MLGFWMKRSVLPILKFIVAIYHVLREHEGNQKECFHA